MSAVHSHRYQALLRRLRRARREAGLTQAEVGAAVGRPQSFVSKCESGERRLDPVELLELASLYGKPLGFFVAEVDPGGASVAADGEAGTAGWRRRNAATRRRRRARRRHP